MSFVVAAVAGTTAVAGAVISSNAADRASKRQAGAIRDAEQSSAQIRQDELYFQERMYEEQRQDVTTLLGQLSEERQNIEFRAQQELSASNRDSIEFEMENRQSLSNYERAMLNLFNRDLSNQLNTLNKGVDTQRQIIGETSRNVEGQIESTQNEVQRTLQSGRDFQLNSIDQAERDIFQGLNESERLALSDMQYLLQRTDVLGATNEQLALRDVSQSIDDAQRINAVANSTAIATIAGNNKRALEALQPYADAGEEALDKQRFLTGLMSNDEQSEYLDFYGDVSSSPIFEYRKQQAEEQLSRSQRARGISQSPSAIMEELNVINQLTSEEFDRQIATNIDMMNRGQSAASEQASILQNQGLNLAGIQRQMGQTGSELALMKAQESKKIRSEAARFRTDALSQATQQSANIRLGSEQVRAQAAQQAGQNRINTDQSATQSLAQNQQSTGLQRVQAQSRFGEMGANLEGQRLQNQMVLQGQANTQGQQLQASTMDAQRQNTLQGMSSRSQNLSNYRTAMSNAERAYNANTQNTIMGQGAMQSQYANTRAGMANQAANSVMQSGMALGQNELQRGMAQANMYGQIANVGASLGGQMLGARFAQGGY